MPIIFKRSAIFVFFPFFSMIACVGAEIITLENGQTYEGEIIEKTDDYVKIESEGMSRKIRFRFMEQTTAQRLMQIPNTDAQQEVVTTPAPPSVYESPVHAETDSVSQQEATGPKAANAYEIDEDFYRLYAEEETPDSWQDNIRKSKKLTAEDKQAMLKEITTEHRSIVYINSASRVMLLIGWIMILINAFPKSILKGLLCLLIPFYAMYYVLAKYDGVNKKLVCFLYLGGSLIQILSFVYIFKALLLPLINN